MIRKDLRHELGRKFDVNPYEVRTYNSSRRKPYAITPKKIGTRFATQKKFQKNICTVLNFQVSTV